MTLPTERRPHWCSDILFMNNTATNIEPATAGNLGQRRRDSSKNLLALIDSAIRAVEPKTDWLKSAPTTAAVCHELDLKAKQPDRVAKLPPEVFTQYDPLGDKFSLQKPQGHIVQFNPETAKALLAAGARLVEDSTLISDDEKKLLVEIQGKMDKFKMELAKSSTAAANAEFFNQSTRRVVETIQSGALPEKNVIRTMDSIHRS